MKHCIHLLFLLISFSLSFPAFASEESTYLNEQYSFSLEYPKTLKMRVFGGAYFDILKDGKLLLEASVEEDLFKVFTVEARQVDSGDSGLHHLDDYGRKHCCNFFSIRYYNLV